MRTTLVPLLLALCALLAPPPAQAQPLPDLGGAEAEAPAAEEVRVVPVEPVPDSLLEARMQSVFARIDDFEAVTVAVDEGVVQLGGTVLRPEAADEAAELAGRFEGVLYVDNDIESDVAVETRVTPAIERVQAYLNQAVRMLPVFGVALLVIFAFWGVSRLLSNWNAPSRRLGITPLVWNLIRRLLRAALMFVGFLLAFDILGLSSMVGAVLGTAGVLGFALAFAFQDIVENYLAGALLSIRQPFNVNDLVQIEDYEGRVVRMNSRELVLLTLEGNHVQLPNATVFKSNLVNFTRNPKRLFHFDAGIDVDENLEHAMAVGIETLDRMNGVMEDPGPFARVQELGDSSVRVRYFGWVDQREADFLKVKSEAIRLVKGALDEAGVLMPEPIYQVRLRTLDDAGPLDGPEAAEGTIRETREPEEIDVRPDGKLEEQVHEDIARSDEENYLS